MSEYRITVVLKSEYEKRSRVCTCMCECFRDAIDIAVSFDMNPETLSIRVDELETTERDISDVFSKLDKVKVDELQ